MDPKSWKELEEKANSYPYMTKPGFGKVLNLLEN